ncbi:MAG: phytanoyl-CoA dioxygenase family protein, partial [Planctomycetota bacterium]
LETQATDGTDLLGVETQISTDLEARAVDLVLDPGDASIHDSFVIHGSGANRSRRRRAGLTLRIANAETVTVDLERHGKPVYYISGDGRAMPAGVRDIRSSLPADPGEHRSKRFQRSFPRRVQEN